MKGRQSEPPEPPQEVQGFVPRRLFTRHISAAFDEPPRRVRHWLDAGLLNSRQPLRGQHRYVTPEGLIAFAVSQGLEVDWYAVIEADEGMQ